jgi:hypothetical protein
VPAWTTAELRAILFLTAILIAAVAALFVSAAISRGS